MREKHIPIVSIIIPVYNVGPYLSDCLSSVVKQTIPDIEVICIDDNSTDNSFTILEEWKQKDSKVKVIRNNTNRGQSYSRNVGLKEATGEYILFVDADDYIYDNLLNKVLSIAEGRDIICFDYLRSDEINQDRVSHNYYLEGVFEGSQYFVEAVLGNNVIYAPWSKIYRRSFLIEHNIFFYEGVVYEDILFYFQCFLAEPRVYSIKDKLYVYRIRAGSTMHSLIYDKNLKSYFTVLYRIVQIYMGSSYDARLDKAIVIFIQDIIKQYIKMYKRMEIIEEHYSNEENNIIKMYRLFRDLPIRGSIGKLPLDTLRESENILIYGAGDMAREVIEGLDYYNIAVSGIVVTNTGENRASILGHSISSIDDYLYIKDKCLIIIATVPRYYQSIVRELEIRGFSNYLELM